MLRGKFYSVADSFRIRFGHINVPASVMVRGLTDVPPSCSMRVPQLVFVVALVDYNFYSGWCEGGSIVIELPVELGLGGETWVYPRRPQEVKCSLCLLHQSEP
jgi:hypothetical protein